MFTFGTVHPGDHTIDKYGAYANVTWQFVSSSGGILITFPDDIPDIDGAIRINRAKVEKDDSINVDTGTYEYVLHASIKHNFYNNQLFVSGSQIVTASVPDNAFVVSISQNVYGEQVKPGTFELTVHPESSSIYDDTFGNLYVSQSGTGSYVGHIFYKKGIAVIVHDTGSANASVGLSGLKITSGSSVYLTYDSSMTFEQHQINITLKPNQFNFSPFNPSITQLYQASGSISESFAGLNIAPKSGSMWALYNLMGAGVIKPYVTSIGLYSENYELLAVAKLSTPIQRTFDTEQIFIIRFDTE